MEISGLDSISKRIARLRRESGISQEEFSDLVGVSRRTIQKIESDKTDFLFSNAIAIAQALGVSLDYLAHGDESMSHEKALLLALINELELGSIKTLLATARALRETSGVVTPTIKNNKSSR
jgi:transcriptional regulator with XRE-family HTH domain